MITHQIDAALAGRRLLDHPYYRSWQEGTLRRSDIGRYAAQYRYFEAALPTALAEAVQGADDPEARRLVQANLDDELAEPAHLDLFERFASAVGAGDDAPGQATERLLSVYRDAADAGAEAVLSVIAAYETQAAEVAATKGAALRRHLGLRSEETAFWDVHAELESDHAGWTVDALALLHADPETVEHWAGRSAGAWWAFLDEQQDLVGSMG